ncbi:MAG: hypothetical protein E6Q76_18690 [Rhizobium sp.]|nr:MAG: hypothetical protein E6Q76_18690 [Rhizobium sp.]
MSFMGSDLKVVAITAGIAMGIASIAACSRSSAPDAASVGGLGECSTDVATDQAIVPALLPSVDLVRQRQMAADQFGNGFRVSANRAELDYIHYLAAQLRKIGATEVTEEPYTFTAWSPKTTKLSVVQGPAPGPVKVAYFIPSSGSTGPDGLTAPVTYLSVLSDVNLVGAVYTALTQQSPGNVLLSVQAALQSAIAGGVSLTQAIASANVAGKIVMYDAPKIALPIGVFQALSVYVNNSSGTMGPEVPYDRPFINQLVLIGAINAALKAAGAAGVIAVVDYPPAAADNAYVPFGGLAIPSVPGIYLDRYTGAALKQQIVDSGVTPLTVKLTLDASESQATSYNVSGLIPGACDTQILVSSHSDGPNSIEDNGPAAILSIADYFARAPASQRRRGLKIVFTGGHMVGSPGINAYIEKHQAELSAKVLTAIEIEHLGAREWLELSPGVMALDGLPEPLVLYAGLGSVQQDENITFAKNFDRSLVTIPLPFGEGPAWASAAGLPKIQVITGPVYLLNGPLKEVSTEYTDYDLEQRQITAFIQMILNLNTQTAQTLRSDQNFPNVALP